MMKNIREIPYNYTSYSDREIVLRFLGQESWDDLNKLRSQRRTGRSARMLFEILGDIWVVSRNHFIKDDLLNNKKRLKQMFDLHEDRLARIESAAADNPLAKKVAAQARQMIDTFYQQFKEETVLRHRVLKEFSKVTHKNNIHFDPFAKVGHATDATDWRQEYPFVVITPETEQEISGIVQVSKKLGLIIIPRGGGTGLCGGSVPLHSNSVVINVERLDRIDQVEMKDIDKMKVPTITAQCGAVTGNVMEASKPYIFATDPTSLWACTIGGNVATNAGGKHAVIWGTCIDNLLSWRMVTPNGKWLLVERLHHNIGRIPPDKEAVFRLSRFEEDGKTRRGKATVLKLPGSLFRKPGLGKDVTHKALGGLPGVQKEGTDGFITSATFVLHNQYRYKRTVCCEFFDHELSKATKAMVEIKERVDSLDKAYIEGLEHFDQKYVKAIDYRSKSTRRERPTVVLLIDVSSDVKSKADKAAMAICDLTKKADGEGFIATTAEEQAIFWSDRTRMAAIAKHTNAFKLNEDVVIPLHRLSEYNDFIEHLNIENSISNKLTCLEAIAEYILKTREKIKSGDRHILSDMQVDDDGYLDEKLMRCLQTIDNVTSNWTTFRDRLDHACNDVSYLLNDIKFSKEESLFRLIQRGALRISYRQEIESPLLDLLRGHDKLRQDISDIHKKTLSSRIVIATHMHAGDGNVHTNIPVNSNDYQMMHDAHNMVEKIMKKSTELGGVISGEHGIGITKLPYMNPQYLEEMVTYKQKVDPDQLFNRGKLMPGTDLTYTYTPSFNLLEMEAVILEAGDLSHLSEEIASCLRCGKCKPVCNTHFPRVNMLYAPRNKILATALIIEAFLYEAQTGSGISFKQFEGLKDVADHCTICHKCETPCPVSIDFGNVTEMIRTLLKDKKQAKLNLGSTLSIAFLVMENPYAIKIMRNILIRTGYKGHQILHKLATKIGIVKNEPASMRNLSGFMEHLVSFAERPLPDIPQKTARSMLHIDKKERNIIPILRDPGKPSNKAVFYFPGCGSERLYSQISLATKALLFDMGLNVVLPPGYICCGYPSIATGDKKRGDKITYDNRVLFHRLRNALSYLDFEAVVVSCGTCFDQLEAYDLEQTFPEAQLIDIHEYLLKNRVAVETGNNGSYLYHEPCHTPLKYYGPEKVIKTLLNAKAVCTKQCCGEAGTLAVARPDISGKIRTRKEEEIDKAKKSFDTEINGKPKKILTSCPSCLQGLSRVECTTDLKTDYIVVELARLLKGENWQQEFLNRVKRGGIEEVLM